MVRTLGLYFENALYYITAREIRKQNLCCLEKEISEMFKKIIEKIEKKIDECQM